MFAAKDTLLTRPSGGYQISRSLRFNSADSAYLNRTPATTTNQKTWTWSGWVKLSAFSADKELFSADSTGGARYTGIRYTGGDALDFVFDDGSGQRIRSSAVYRDPSAWYHVVAAMDTTQATASNRMKLYVNGVQITTFAVESYPSQNADSDVNSTRAHNLGRRAEDSAAYLNGYMTEVNFIDGTQLTPSSFGETDTQTGVWKPKAYSGSYGTNGFYLNFSDNSNTTAATLGKDYSGNGNNWTPNNFSVTAGVGNDSLVDVPTPYGVDTGVGGTVRGNYATLNPVAVPSAYVSTVNGNLQQGTVGGGATQQEVPITFAFNFSGSNKWYAEVNVITVAGTYYPSIGISPITKNFSPINTQGGNTTTSTAYMATGEKYNSNALSAYGSSFTNGDVIGIAVDEAAGTVVMYKNNVSQGTLVSSLTGLQFLTVTAHNSTNFYFNAGQRPFTYTAPSGFKALCTQNLPTPTIGATTATQAGKYFNTVIYNGANQTPQNITGVGFQPDFTWIKWRANTYYHNLFDVIRGVNNVLSSNAADAEGARAGTLTSFNSDGFSLGNDSTYSGVNLDATSYVAWNWKANGAGSSNTAGSITSTVSANTTSGFSVVTWTAGSGAGTVGHGLGATPQMIITKIRSTVDNWYVYHQDIGNTKTLFLDTTNGQLTTTVWNNTSPTSSVFTYFGTNTQTYVAYCFAEVAGYSKFGSYTGNGSADGPFVFTGFRPAYVMAKITNDVANWAIHDVARNTYNVVDNTLLADLSDAEYTSNGPIDIVSNGFKIRTTNSNWNASSLNYIYIAFASNPFKYSLAR